MGDIGVTATVTVAETGVSATLVEDAKGYVEPVQEPETKPVTKPETKPAPTGDSVVALAVLSVVSLLGMAVISKKRG